jgi:bile acid-coenzyme A ligase
MSVPELVSAGHRISLLAADHPDATAIVFVPEQGDEQLVSWGELDRRSSQVARLLAAHGVDQGSTIVVATGNTPEHFFVAYGAWKLGALLLTLRPQLPAPERDALLDIAQPAVVVADWHGIAHPLLTRADLVRAEVYSDAPLPDRVPNPGKALGSGGSTGRPKLIVKPGPWAFPPGALLAAFAQLGFTADGVQLIVSPVYHEIGFNSSHLSLFEGLKIVVMEHFEAARAVDLVERHQPTLMLLPPIMLQRMAALPDIRQRDLSSLRGVTHAGAPCAPWLKRAWIDLIGAEKVHELFGGTENNGYIYVRGDDWLARPGTLGRPYNCEIRILDDEGVELPSGRVGEIFMKNLGSPDPTFEYRGAPPAKRTADGLTSLGDLGWLDADGYLFLADRRVDLIITGGANVYAAEVEMALSEHPAVDDVAVIGLPDPEWGKRVHAVIQPRDMASLPSESELKAHCRARLAAYKAPKTYEFVARLPRTEAGKLRRSGLVDERSERSERFEHPEPATQPEVVQPLQD